ncbi:galactose mutarotase [Rhizobiaceae bacterium BDR2-2]|uniref:Aldose 1-epimerase n=1 Tax=Ectorhizobium quercum TaxID=2965071 RepID=A0AAE3SV56_9HYPH|nr:aldose epimerase family protein [Ectorhizobium quercum]MCX8997985.1 galactose mutarotase [Ectorhizobium quercum]
MAAVEDRVEIFGTLENGETVRRATIRGGGLTVSVITYGAVIQDVRLEGYGPSLVLGFDNFADYRQHSRHFGASPGRVANRIGGGTFTLDGAVYHLELNENGVTHLHGGKEGFGKRNWTLTTLSENSVTLSIHDPDGHAGYPGNVDASVTYSLPGDGVLSCIYRSRTDRPTPANLCQHSYFTLDEAETVLGTRFAIAADHYLPVDERSVPTGEIRPVDGTPFDLRRETVLGDRIGADFAGFDHNICLSPERVARRHVARAVSPASGISLDVATTEPGVQFYTAHKLSVPVPGHDGRTYGPFAGFCLETQIWPDSINRENFPNAVLRPGEELVQETDYIFRKA